jgi:ankyrin repeat protein
MMTDTIDGRTGDADSPQARATARLREAVEAGKAASVSAALQAGADPNGTVDGGATLLATAAADGRIDVVRALVAAGADVNAESPHPMPDRDHKGAVTPVLTAMIRGHREVTAYLKPLSNKKVRSAARKRFAAIRGKRGRRDPRFKPFLAAAEAGELQTVAAAIEAGVEVNAGDEFWGQTALAHASRCGHTEIVQRLVDAGADPNIDNPLGLARNCAIAEALIRAGADVNHFDDELGVTPLYSSLHDRLDVTALLIAAGADLNPRTLPHGSPLATACAHGWVESALLLIKAGADVKCRPSKRDWPPLLYAAHSGSAPIVTALFAGGAHANARDTDGNTPLSLATANGHSAVAEILTKAGVQDK